jgi:hypothetical protein
LYGAKESDDTNNLTAPEKSPCSSLADTRDPNFSITFSSEASELGRDPPEDLVILREDLRREESGMVSSRI